MATILLFLLIADLINSYFTLKRKDKNVLSYGALIAAGVATTIAAIKYAKARKQAKDAERLRKETEANRPKYSIPQAKYDNLALAKNRSAQGLPGMGYMLNKSEVAGQAAVNNAIQTGQSPNNTLATIAAVDASQKNFVSDLGYKNAVYKDQGLNTLMDANSDIATEQNRQFEWDKKVPYLNAMDYATKLKFAAETNKDTAINDFGNASSSYAMSQSYGQDGYGGDGTGGNRNTQQPTTYSPSQPSSNPSSMGRTDGGYGAPNTWYGGNTQTGSVEYQKFKQKYPNSNLTYQQYVEAYPH